MDKEQTDSCRYFLKPLCRLHLQARKDSASTLNSMGVKRNGAPMKVDRPPLTEYHVADLRYWLDEADDRSKRLSAQMETILNQFPIYDWLREVKGISTVISAWIIAEFDIDKAETSAQMHRYAGMAPGWMLGLKRCKKKEYSKKMGELIKEIPSKTGKGTDVIYRTDTYIRMDKLTPEFLSPYNKSLKTALLGWAGDSFVYSSNTYYHQFYLPYKHRLAHSAQMTKEILKGGKVIDVEWRNASPKHRHMAAKRYMIKQFVIDLYKQWRTVEGLSVTVPYSEVRLGRPHHSSPKGDEIPYDLDLPEVDMNINVDQLYV